MPYDEFVNLMGNLQKRAGRVPVRVGGNSQEDAILVDSANLGTAILRKDGGDDSDTYDVSPQSFRGGSRSLVLTIRVGYNAKGSILQGPDYLDGYALGHEW